MKTPGVDVKSWDPVGRFVSDHLLADAFTDDAIPTSQALSSYTWGQDAQDKFDKISYGKG